MDTGASAVASQEPAPPPKPELHWTEYIKALGMFLLGVAGVILSIATFHMQRDTGRMQLEMQQDALASQRLLAAGQLAANTVASLGCKADERQEIALTLLSLTAPQYVRQITPILLRCRSRSLSDDRLDELGNLAEIRMEFRQQLDTAQEFLHHGHDEEAALAYAEACRWIPDVVRVKPEQLSGARKALEGRRYSEAADLFGHLFRNAPIN